MGSGLTSHGDHGGTFFAFVVSRFARQQYFFLDMVTTHLHKCGTYAQSTRGTEPHLHTAPAQNGFTSNWFGEPRNSSFQWVRNRSTIRHRSVTPTRDLRCRSGN